MFDRFLQIFDRTFRMRIGLVLFGGLGVLQPHLSVIGENTGVSLLPVIYGLFCVLDCLGDMVFRCPGELRREKHGKTKT